MTIWWRWLPADNCRAPGNQAIVAATGLVTLNANNPVFDLGR